MAGQVQRGKSWWGCDGRTSSRRVGVLVRLYGDFRARIRSRNCSSGPRICSSGHDFPLWPERDRGRRGRPAVNAPSGERACGCRGRPRATETATPRRRAAGGGGMRCRTLTAAVDDGGDEDSRSTSHIAMARARRRRNGTPWEDPQRGRTPTAVDIARASAARCHKQQQWPVTGAGPVERQPFQRRAPANNSSGR